jgi:hypothetical protein
MAISQRNLLMIACLEGFAIIMALIFFLAFGPNLKVLTSDYPGQVMRYLKPGSKTLARPLTGIAVANACQKQKAAGVDSSDLRPIWLPTLDTLRNLFVPPLLKCSVHARIPFKPTVG